MEVKKFEEYADKIIENCSQIIIGKEEVIKQLIVCFLAEGNVLLEDLPGTGKTMLLRSFAKSLGLEFKRIQFTPDLLPSDLTGINFYNQKTGDFELRKGPLFTNLVLADEINRTTPRTQSALLEAMEEKQVSIDGKTYPLNTTYKVMSTENPIESYGTFPLPEAQVDRFFMKLSLGFMSKEEEIYVLRRTDSKILLEDIGAVVTVEETKALQQQFNEVVVSDDIANYIMDIIEATRKSDLLVSGISTRGSLALYKASQIIAALNGRSYVIPEDVQQEAHYVLDHRIQLVSSSHLSSQKFLDNILEEIKVPME